jgi:xanthine dehydrogenase iron-sulfur cluster and FAD-binding subunit A
MKPAPFAYLAAESLDQALEALADARGGDAKLLAGGQSLIPLLNFRLATPGLLIDLNCVGGMDAIEPDAGGIRIGAMARHDAIEHDPRIARDVPLLHEAITRVGHPAVRARGTLGGSLAHADPAAELPAVAVCLGAKLTIVGSGGRRRVMAADEFFVDYLTTALQPDEVLLDVWFPTLAPGCGCAWLEFSRRHGDFALAGVAVWVRVADGVVDQARIVAAGVGSRPERVVEAEATLVGHALVERAAVAGAMVREILDPPSDMHATGEYRSQVAAVLTERAVRLAGERVLAGQAPSDEAPSDEAAAVNLFAQTRPDATAAERRLPAVVTGPAEKAEINVQVNGRAYRQSVEPRLLLSDFLRHELRLTGTHVGCEHGVCGACTILLDGRPARACLTLAVQTDGAEITTVEGLASADGPLHPIQQAFWDTHGLQCGFCTPGFLMSTLAVLSRTPHPTDDELREALSGNLCRCTGYQNIVKAVRLAASRLAQHSAG